MLVEAPSCFLMLLTTVPCFVTSSAPLLVADGYAAVPAPLLLVPVIPSGSNSPRHVSVETIAASHELVLDEIKKLCTWGVCTMPKYCSPKRIITYKIGDG